MLDFFRDPAWQFVGVVLALLSLGGAFWIYWLQRQAKELAFGLISSHRLVAVADEVSSRVTVQLDGKPIKNLHLLVYGLKNSGHRAISAGDFERPLTIHFSEGYVVSSELVCQFPKNLGATLEGSDRSVRLEPLLLNSGDHLLIQVLLSAPVPSHASVDARIVDVASLVAINSSPLLPPFFRSGMPLLIAISVGLSLISFFASQDRGLSYALLGLAAFSAIFGFTTRLLEGVGASARRRVGDA